MERSPPSCNDCRLKDRIQPVRIRLIRAEQAKILGVELNDVAQIFSQLARCLRNHLARTGNRQCVLGKVGQIERLQQAPAVDMGICAHAAIPSGASSASSATNVRPYRTTPRADTSASRLRASSNVPDSRRQWRAEPDAREMFLRSERHLLPSGMSSPSGCEDNHRPRRSRRGLRRDHCPRVFSAPLLLDFPDFRVATIQSGRKKLMHDCGIVAFHKIGGVSMPSIKRD